MTFAIDKETVRKALSAHAAIGLLAGALLYIVCVTGTVLVFYEEWQRIEQRNAPEMTAIAPDAAQAAVANVLATERGKTPTTHLYVHLPVAALPRTTVTTDTQAFHIDSAGKIAMKEEIAWSDFLYALHYTLNLPALFGMIVVGMLGVMMLALSLTGVLAHPRIFRDAFRFRARHPGGVGLADWHNRLSVWTLPFGIAIALTGATIGLGVLTAQGLSARFYKGDIEKTYATVFGIEPESHSPAGTVPDVATALRYMAAHHPDVRPTYVTIHEPLTAKQHVQVLADHEHRLIYGETYNFDASGRFVSKAGLSDGHLGQQAAASNYKLHFGDYGGLPVKIAYFLFGLAISVVAATGTFIWLGKRARRGIHEPRLSAGWHAIVWGTPLMLAATFLARALLGNAVPLVAIFWIGLAAILIGALAIGARWNVGRALRTALALALGAGGIALATGG